ncbi:hypothetical protein K0U27_06265 [archaeon]|nr:hypothetical protein [archaeon]
MNIQLLVLIGMVGTVGMWFIPESLAEKSDSQNVGKIQWFGSNSNSEIIAYKIQVIDKDMDKDSDKIDKFKIRILSDADPVGIVISLYETEKDSGIFDSLVYFSEDVSTGQRLRVYDGGEATAIYRDRTLQSSFVSDELEISDTVTIYYPINNPLGSQNQFIRIEDESFSRQSLQTGETISESGTLVSLIIGSFGSILIIFFLALYAIKKIRAK